MPSATFYNLPAEKRERLLRAAREEFSRVPYESASVNRIIRSAGIPRGSFYMYFTDKEELFGHLMDSYGALLERRMGELLEQRGQQLVSALTPGITVPADASLLGKAVGNLLSNASRYSPEGAEIRVTAAARGAWAVLTVENTGARIPAEALPHLFEAFYRAEPSRSRATGGSGLGLYLVRMIVERHGGTCRIENSADGVCFTALLPRLSTENT